MTPDQIKALRRAEALVNARERVEGFGAAGDPQSKGTPYRASMAGEQHGPMTEQQDRDMRVDAAHKVSPLSTAGAAAAAANDGSYFGFGDELNAATLAAMGGQIQPSGEVGAFDYSRSFGSRYNDALQYYRGEQEAFAEEAPVTSTIAEIGGAMLIPGAQAATPGRAAAVGGAYGAAQGFGEGEGGASERLKEAGEGAALGALFGFGTAKAIDIGSARFKRMFSRTAERPTVMGLRAAKNAAYDAVDSAGERFTPDDMANLMTAAESVVEGSNYVPGVDRQTDAALKLLKSRQGQDMTLGQLDKLRQNFWGRYRAAENETAILDVIGAIDELIESRAGSSELMKAARVANSRYKKAEMLDHAFQKAADQTAATGSGGNILNKYRQAVTSIINDPKKAKWFSKDEVDLMRGFVQGSVGENTLRRIGKLAPGGNGLMSALNLYAAAVDPGMLAVTGTAQAAKGMADRSAMQGKEAILDAVSTGSIPRQQPRNYYKPGIAGGVIGSGLTQN